MGVTGILGRNSGVKEAGEPKPEGGEKPTFVSAIVTFSKMREKKLGLWADSAVFHLLHEEDRKNFLDISFFSFWYLSLCPRSLLNGAEFLSILLLNGE